MTPRKTKTPRSRAASAKKPRRTVKAKAKAKTIYHKPKASVRGTGPTKAAYGPTT